MVHAEVYTDTSLESTTTAVQDYNLAFEPVLYLADADGVITSRLDSIYDVAELRGELTKLSGQLNDWPHPHVRVALGLSMENPACCRPSL